jgi:sporulation protein YlmC with PRC-barrel domain
MLLNKKFVFCYLFLLFFCHSLFAQFPTEWPYELGKPLDQYFNKTTRVYKLNHSIFNENEYRVVKLFVEDNKHHEGATELEFDAILQINDKYLNIKLGLPSGENGKYEIYFSDVVGVKKRRELILNSGCFSQAGCLSIQYMFFNHSSGELSAIKIDGYDSFERLGSEGEMMVIHNNYFDQKTSNCYQIYQSYKLSKNSIIKTKTRYKKVIMDCVG